MPGQNLASSVAVSVAPPWLLTTPIDVIQPFGMSGGLGCSVAGGAIGKYPLDP
jgi:hypothetical protein